MSRTTISIPERDNFLTISFPITPFPPNTNANLTFNSTNGTLLITSPITSVSTDLSVGSSLQTATIDYTDGDVAMTIADGGAVTFGH